MPISHVLATRLAHALSQQRRMHLDGWMLPDAKTQMTVEYVHAGGEIYPQRVKTIVISQHHRNSTSHKRMVEELRAGAIAPAIPGALLDELTINWSIQLASLLWADLQLTLRLPVIRPQSTLMAAGETRLQQPSVGKAEPLALFVDTLKFWNSGTCSNSGILNRLQHAFDFCPGRVLKDLKLKESRPQRYQRTAVFEHFGRDDPDFPWEMVKPL
eukprot:jgi/Chlat1/2971/Chrsp2S04696